MCRITFKSKTLMCYILLVKAASGMPSAVYYSMLCLQIMSRCEMPHAATFTPVSYHVDK